MNSEILIPSKNLSIAWADAFLRVQKSPSGELDHPLLITVEEFDKHNDPIEVPAIRAAVDEAIDAVNSARAKPRVQTAKATAGTIFPRMCWSPYLPIPADELFERYKKKIYPRLRKLHRLNQRGTYFLRMIESTGLKRKGDRLVPHEVNQLGDILKWCQREARHDRRMRRSALQLSIYDPSKDHSGGPRAFFPCLQQVSFGYSAKGFFVSAYYPAEYIFDRGYGNYLGLCHLGGFMAHQLKMPLHRVSVFISLPELGAVTKGKLQPLVNRLKPLVRDC